MKKAIVALLLVLSSCATVPEYQVTKEPEYFCRDAADCPLNKRHCVMFLALCEDPPMCGVCK